MESVFQIIFGDFTQAFDVLLYVNLLRASLAFDFSSDDVMDV